MSANDVYDVIIAGGGPGGAAAAYHLGKAGRRVLVLEKETFPRYKACGGAISARLLQELPFDFEPVIESRPESITYACQGQAVTFEIRDGPLWMTMRPELDEFLLKQVPADLRLGDAVVSVEEKPDRVIVRTQKGREFEGRYLIGADGPNSIVAHSLDLRRDKTLLGAIEVEAPVPPEIFARYKDGPVMIFGEIAMGYLWIFPKAEHLSVGIGALHPKPGELQAALARVMEGWQIPIQDLPMHGHPVPIHIRREKISTARSLLVGDAAGLVDPMSGEGIRYAVQSGRYAAEAILADRIQDYERVVERKIGARHRLNWLVAQTVYRRPGRYFELLVRNPFARPAFVDLYSERTTAQWFFLRLLAAVPPYLITKGLRKMVPMREKTVRAKHLDV